MRDYYRDTDHSPPNVPNWESNEQLWMFGNKVPRPSKQDLSNNLFRQLEKLYNWWIENPMNTPIDRELVNNVIKAYDEWLQ